MHHTSLAASLTSTLFGSGWPTPSHPPSYDNRNVSSHCLLVPGRATSFEKHWVGIVGWNVDLELSSEE